MTTAAAIQARPKAQSRRFGFLGKHPLAFVLLAPYLIYLLGIFVYPLVLQFTISFRDYYFAAPGVVVDRPWVGLDNYTRAFTDPTFQAAMLHSVEFLIINVPLTVFGALILATAMDTKIRALTFFRTSYYLPYVTASVAIIAVWLFMFGNGGLVNTILGPLAPDPSWLINSTWAMPMIAIYVTWKQLGYFIVLYLAALQNIPKELYESAAVDGANRRITFRHVTMPGVRPATVLVVVLATITGMNLFTEPYLLTNGGGPNGASMTPVFYMYQRGVEQGNAGYAAAIGMILIVVTLVIALVQRRFLKEE